MGQKFTANKFHIIHQLAISWFMALKNRISFQDTMIFRLVQDSIP